MSTMRSRLYPRKTIQHSITVKFKREGDDTDGRVDRYPTLQRQRLSPSQFKLPGAFSIVVSPVTRARNQTKQSPSASVSWRRETEQLSAALLYSIPCFLLF